MQKNVFNNFSSGFKLPSLSSGVPRMMPSNLPQRRMDSFNLPTVQENGVAGSVDPMFMYRGRLYKTQLGSSLPDLSSRLQRQRSRMPRLYEKFSFQVQTDRNLGSKSKLGYLPILTPRTPVVVEARVDEGEGGQQADHHRMGQHDGHVLEIHADLLDVTFNANSKPGAKPPWKPDCFCPRCGFMREQWVEENRKPFRPFSRQRESTLLAMNLARERTRYDAHSEKASARDQLLLQAASVTTESSIEKSNSSLPHCQNAHPSLGIQG